MKRAALIFFWAVVGFVLGVMAALLLSTFSKPSGSGVEAGMANGLFWAEIVCPAMGLLGAFAGGLIASGRLKK